MQTGGPDAEDGKVKAGEGERDGQTWSEQAAARDSAGCEERELAPEGFSSEDVKPGDEDNRRWLSRRCFMGSSWQQLVPAGCKGMGSKETSHWGGGEY